MIYKNMYWLFKQAIPSDVCDKIIEHGKSLVDETARTGNFEGPLNKEAIKILKTEQRDSNVSWIGDKWIFDYLTPHIQTANKNANWNFDIHSAEPVQFTKYKLNQFYNWHCDTSEEVIHRPQVPHAHGKIRKLSCVVFLSDPKDYVGGQFKFDFRNNRVGCNIMEVTENQKGNIIVFPSYCWHKVFPVTSGERYSLVGWYLGAPYK